MEKINYFNYCAFVLLALILFSIFFRKITHGRLNQCFLAIVIISLISTGFDIFAIILDNLENPKYSAFQYIVHIGYLLFHNITTPAYISYLIFITDTAHKFRKSIFQQVLLITPISIVLIALISNPFNHLLFTCDNGVYQRGKLFPIVYIGGAVYVLMGLWYIIKYKKLFSTQRFVALIAVFPIAVVAVIIQMINAMYPVEMFFYAIAILFILIIIQRPEESMDSVTKLNNFSDYAQSMKQSFINEKNFNVILINTSNYYSLQDILGYDEKGNMLCKIAEILKKVNKKYKAFAELYYLDRGRFRVVLSGKRMKDTEKIAEEINQMLKEGLTINKMSINLTSYVCIAHCPDDIEDFETLITFGNDLDKIYNYTGEVVYAKTMMGENRYNIMREIDRIIDNAILNNKFLVYYQPIYSVCEKRFTSAEALLRLIDEKYGFISPGLFIPAAEKSGAIHKIGNCVLESVCQFISSEQFSKLGLEYIEINLSVAQCMQSNLSKDVIGIIEKYNVSPDKINLEITETATTNSQNVMYDNIKVLSEYGISFSLDDFGTGYSNMKRMVSLPLKIVKLDKTFVDFGDNPKTFTVLKSTVKMLKEMNMEIVVEGIETEEKAKQFSEMKCEYIQGYYYSKPLPKSDFVDFIYNKNCLVKQ